MTALMCAARDGRLDVVQLLVDSGAQVEQEDSRGWTVSSFFFFLKSGIAHAFSKSKTTVAGFKKISLLVCGDYYD